MNTRNTTAELADPVQAALKRMLGTYSYLNELTGVKIQEAIDAVDASTKDKEIGAAILQARRALESSAGPKITPQPPSPQMGLPLAIMNMPVNGAIYTANYLMGHRAARHAAADIALKWGDAVVAGQAQQKPVARVTKIATLCQYAHVDLLGQIAVGAELFAAPLPATYSMVEPAPRPSDDDLWDQALKERDHNANMADKLATAIGEYFGVEIGEHSSANCPWHAALRVMTLKAITTRAARDMAIAEAMRDACGRAVRNSDQPFAFSDVAGVDVAAVIEKIQ